MKFEPVDPKDLPNFRESRRGRVSYPILKGFMETNHLLVKLDRTGMQQSLQGLYSSLTAYCRSHKLPIKVFMRSGEIYLMRLDMEEDGTIIENWQEHEEELKRERAKPITTTEVETRYEEERGQVTK